MDSEPSSNKTEVSQNFAPRQFFPIMFAPAIAALIFGVLGQSMSSDELSVAIKLMYFIFFLSLVAGAFCSKHLVHCHSFRSATKKIFAGIGYFLVCTAASGTLGFGGCLMVVGLNIKI